MSAIIENEHQPIGWWKAITPNGREWATERYEDDTIEKALADAIATFGKGTTIEME